MTRIRGNNPSQYLGVNAPIPPNTIERSNDPTTRDYFGFNIGDFWVNRGTTNAPLQRIWILTNKANHIATWTLIINGGGGPVVGLQPQRNGVNNGAVVNPLLGIININNTDNNLIPSNGGGNTLNLNFAPNIVLPAPPSGVTLTVTEANSSTLAVDIFGSVAIENNGDLALTNGNLSVENNEVNASANAIIGRKNRAGGVITSGDALGTLEFQGFDGNTVPGTGGYTTGASIASVSGGTIGGGGNQRVPADLTFSTHRDAVAAGPVPRMNIAPDGRVLVNIADLAPTFRTTGNMAVAAGIDEGGTAAFVTVTGVSNTAPNGAGTFTIKSKSANNLDSSGFIKIYIGTNEFWIPIFSTPSP